MQTIQVRLTKRLIEKAQELVNQGLYSNKSEVIRDSLRRLCFPKINISKRKFKVIYSSDIHGNLIQYKKLFDRAIMIKAEAIIIGGDLLPKDKKNRTPEKQQEFLKKKLIPLMKIFHKKNKTHKNSCRVFVMLGNDDFKKNSRLLKDNEKKGDYKVIHNKCIPLYENFKIMGYSYIPLTPFNYKDWEKLDLKDEFETKDRKNIILKGKINNLIKKNFDLKNRKDTIERDLGRLLKNVDSSKLILVTHSPPYNTSLDMISRKEHVGSKAVKKIIEDEQPLITLHGHIHETVKFSGKFMESLGNTRCMTSGNDHLSEDLAVIEFNLFEPNRAKRIII